MMSVIALDGDHAQKWRGGIKGLSFVRSPSPHWLPTYPMTARARTILFHATSNFQLPTYIHGTVSLSLFLSRRTALIAEPIFPSTTVAHATTKVMCGMPILKSDCIADHDDTTWRQLQSLDSWGLSRTPISRAIPSPGA